jgi:hypothetical protein
MHDEADDAEQDLPGLLHDLEQRVGFAANRMQRETEEHGQQQRLQDIPVGKGAKEGGGDDVEDELGDAGHAAGGGVLGDGVGIERRRIRIHAHTRLHDIHDHQPDEERDRGDHLEVKQRQAAGLADLLELRHPGNAGHHRAENDGGNEQAYELDEAVAEGLQLLGKVRPEDPEQDAERDADEHLYVQRTPDCAAHAVPCPDTAADCRVAASLPRFARPPCARRLSRTAALRCCRSGQ